LTYKFKPKSAYTPEKITQLGENYKTQI